MKARVSGVAFSGFLCSDLAPISDFWNFLEFSKNTNQSGNLRCYFKTVLNNLLYVAVQESWTEQARIGWIVQ